MATQAFHADRIFDGDQWHETAAVLVQAGRVQAIVPQADAPAGQQVAGWLTPGLIDLQVNGGGGVLFNNAADSAGIETICRAHAGFGTTSVMVTLITDCPEVTAQAIGAVQSARVQGLLGLHLEGPHLAQSRKGTHDPALIRPMQAQDLAQLLATALRPLIVTVAPESVSLDQTRALAAAGITVSLGHSDCSAETALCYAEAGASMVTHLFNAMSQITPRAPGLVGAALDDGRLSAGVIADGFHLNPSVLRLALRAKTGSAPLFLVSDAMATVGSDLTSFALNGRQIFRAKGRLTLADGTLAGADIALLDAVRYLHQVMDLPLAQALQMATIAPAAALGLHDRGHLRVGARADFISLSPQIRCTGTWIDGRRVA